MRKKLTLGSGARMQPILKAPQRVIKIEKFCKKVIKLGAKRAKVIQIKSIATAAWVRKKCQYGCDLYGQRLTCPPYSPTPEETQRILDCFKKAILIHGDEETDISKIVAELEEEIFLEGFYKAFGMGAGPCELCRTCDVKKPCRHPTRARPSMEASGIDVFKTARANGFKIEVLTSDRCEGNYFGVVLIE